MTFSARLFASTALLTLGSFQPALADVTADDVWQNIKTYIDAFGGKLTAPTTRSGNVLSVGEMSVSWTLPFDAGTLSFSESGFDLTEKGDGTVSFSFPETITARIAGDIKDKGAFSGAVALTHDGWTMTASGVPDDINYTYAVNKLGFELTEIEAPDLRGGTFEMRGTLSDLVGTGQITTSSMVATKSQVSIGEQSYEGTVKDSVGNVTNVSGGAKSATANSSFALPRSGTDLMNLAAAFERGMELNLTSKTQGYWTEQTTKADDKLVSAQKSSAASYDVNLVLNRDRLILDGAGTESEITMQMPVAFPMPIHAKIAETAGRLVVPVSAKEDLQDAAMVMDLDGLEVDESLWALIDPAQSLPRESMKLRLDLSAKVKSFFDWFNFMDVAARGKSGETPGEIHALTLNDLTLELAGAALNGKGAATFDNTDKVTFGGFPKPAGILDLTLTGGNALLDKLVALGLLPQEQAMGARMMVGMVAKADPAAGDDVLRSHIEFTESGELLANGMRLK